MWHVTPCSLAGKIWPLGGGCCLKFQSWKNCCSALNMEKNSNLKNRHLSTRLYGVTYQITLFLAKLTGPQLVKKFFAFYWTRRFITAFTIIHHLSLSWARSIQPMPYPTSWRFILILFFNLHLGLPSGLFPLAFPNKICRHLYWK